MLDLLRRYPLHPWLVASYPVLALLAHNLTEVLPSAGRRALLLSWCLATILLLLFWLFTRDFGRSALLTSLFLVLFFSYGHIYRYLPDLNANVRPSWHPYLGLFCLTLLTLGAWGIWRVSDVAAATQAINLVSLALLVLPAFSLLSYSGSGVVNLRGARAVEIDEPLRFTGRGRPPDVYFILLDTYMRGDALARDMRYDNSAFLDNLKQLGFYVAECSRPNYDYTRASLTSTLNMDYLPALRAELESQGFDDPKALWALLLPNKTRRLFEAMGYRTVAFETTIDWTEMGDADVYLAPEKDQFTELFLLPFETLLLKSTPAVILMEPGAQPTGGMASNASFPYNYHVQIQRYILDTLPALAKTPGPKFVFVHILIPHTPYVFRSDGTVRVDPNYYGGKYENAVNWQYQIEGYDDSVTFINSRLLPILKTLIQDSATPPIIIMEGDHGLTRDNRTQNLSAYLLPGGGAKDLYPSITPVNSFRVVFNRYFGADYQLLPDETYTGFKLPNSTGRLVRETAPECSH